MLYSSSQVGMDAGLYLTLVSLLFSAISISISNIFRYYFYGMTIQVNLVPIFVKLGEGNMQIYLNCYY